MPLGAPAPQSGGGFGGGRPPTAPPVGTGPSSPTIQPSRPAGFGGSPWNSYQAGNGPAQRYQGPWYQGAPPAAVPAWFTAANNARGGLRGLEDQAAANDREYALRRGLDTGHYNSQAGFNSRGLWNANVGANIADADNLSNWNAIKARYGVDTGLNRANMGFAATGLRLGNRDVDLRMGRDSRALLSDAAGRGATITQGFRQGNIDIKQQGGNDKAKNQLNYDSTTTRLKAEQSNRDIDLKRSNDIFDNVGARNNLDRDNARLAYDRGMESLGYDLATSRSILRQAHSNQNTSLKAQGLALINQATQLGISAGGAGL